MHRPSGRFDERSLRRSFSNNLAERISKRGARSAASGRRARTDMYAHIINPTCVEVEVLFLSRVIYIGRDISSLMVHLEAGANYYSLRHHALTARSKQRLALAKQYDG